MNHRRVLVALALTGGLGAAVAGGIRGGDRVPRLAGAVTRGEGGISAIALARRIRSGEAGLRVIDLGAAAGDVSVPGSVRASLDSLLGVAPTAGQTLVVYGDGVQAAQAWVLLALHGHEVRFLVGGIDAWDRAVLSPVLPAYPTDEETRLWTDVVALSRHFGGFPVTGGPRTGIPPAWLDQSGARPTTPPRRRGC